MSIYTPTPQQMARDYVPRYPVGYRDDLHADTKRLLVHRSQVTGPTMSERSVMPDNHRDSVRRGGRNGVAAKNAERSLHRRRKIARLHRVLQEDPRRSWTARELAARTGITVRHVQTLLNGSLATGVVEADGGPGQIRHYRWVEGSE